MCYGAYALGERIRHEVTASCRHILLQNTSESNAISHKILPFLPLYKVAGAPLSVRDELSHQSFIQRGIKPANGSHYVRKATS